MEAGGDENRIINFKWPKQCSLSLSLPLRISFSLHTDLPTNLYNLQLEELLLRLGSSSSYFYIALTYPEDLYSYTEHPLINGQQATIYV